MSCEGAPTGESRLYFELRNPLGISRVCVNLADATTMYEVKKALYVVSGYSTRLDTAVWTPEDESALRMWATDEGEPNLLRDGPLGWTVPSGEAIQLLVYRLGWRWRQAHDARMEAEFPWLFYAADQNFVNRSMRTSDPVIGAAASSPEPAPMPAPEPEAPTPNPVAPALPRPSPPPGASTVSSESSGPSYRMLGAILAAGGIAAALYYTRHS